MSSISQPSLKAPAMNPLDLQQLSKTFHTCVCTGNEWGADCLWPHEE